MTTVQRHDSDVLVARGTALPLGPRPLIMGVVNASPESFSDGRDVRGFDSQLRRAAELVAAGADLLDVGGESAITNRPQMAVDAEIERVAPLVEAIVAELGVPVSVDTYKPPVAEAALVAGAAIVNDVSGLRDPALAAVCARAGAALVLVHTRAAPKQRLQDPDRYPDVVADVVGFLAERMDTALGLKVARESIVLDPGPDFAKTPAQTIEVLRNLNALAALGRPLLVAVSRKDFIGALTGRRPTERLAGTLAAIEFCVRAGGRILRVHDVAAVRDYLDVREVLLGGFPIDPGLAMSESIRHEHSSAG